MIVGLFIKMIFLGQQLKKQFKYFLNIYIALFHNIDFLLGDSS